MSSVEVFPIVRGSRVGYSPPSMTARYGRVNEVKWWQGARRGARSDDGWYEGLRAYVVWESGRIASWIDYVNLYLIAEPECGGPPSQVKRPPTYIHVPPVIVRLRHTSRLAGVIERVPMQRPNDDEFRPLRAADV